jgi:hypothetical protein
MKTKLILGAFAVLSLSCSVTAQQLIFPGSMSLDPLSVTHGQEFGTERWAIDATGAIQSTFVNATESISYDYSATPTPYGNWSVGGSAQGPGNIFTLPFTAGVLTNVVDAAGSSVSLIDGEVYRLAYTIKPTEFSYGPGLGTWAIGQGNDYSVNWNYNGNLGNSLVTLDVDSWQTVSFDFTYAAGFDFVSISQTLNGGAPTATRLTGSGGPTPGANLDAPTIQFAGASPVPEPSAAMLLSLSGLLGIMRRRR